MTVRQTDVGRQTNRQTGRQTARQAARQTDRQTDRQAERERERDRERERERERERKREREIETERERERERDTCFTPSQPLRIIIYQGETKCMATTSKMLIRRLRHISPFMIGEVWAKSKVQ